MKAPDLRPSSQLVALVAAALLLCLGALLLTNSGSSGEAIAIPVINHTSQSDEGVPGDGHPSSAGYLAISMEEAENADRDPINSQLLTALLLLAGFFGSALVLLKGGLSWNGYVVSFAGCLPFPPLQRHRQARAAPLLAVFRL